jgi:hypothetical protein
MDRDMNSEQILDRIYSEAAKALGNAPKDKTVSAEAFKALEKIRRMSLEVPSAITSKAKEIWS